MNETTPTIDHHHAMLLVMDYQTAILNRLPDAHGLLARMAEVIHTARTSGVQVGYVRVAFDDSDYAVIPETNKTFKAIMAGRQAHSEAPETAIHDDVAPEVCDLIVRKTRVGAFSTTDLDKQLRGRKIDTLILAGISTSGVVLSTVREAADRDYQVYVLEDGCSDRDQDVHNFLTQKIFPRQAYVISIADLPNLLDAR